jgi:vacuolar protein-sorting-associated protein 4
MTWRDVPASKLLEPPLTTEDFYTVVNKTKATVGEEDTKKCEAWTEMYGEDGS